MSFNSRNFGLTVLEKQLFKVSIVNFNPTEKRSSTKEVAYSRARTAEATSLSCRKVNLSKKGTCSCLK